jgi:hypothetical protein
LKRGDLAGLLARGRNGQVIVVKDNYNNVKTGEFNDTTIAEFVSLCNSMFHRCRRITAERRATTSPTRS